MKKTVFFISSGRSGLRCGRFRDSGATHRLIYSPSLSVCRTDGRE